MTVTHIVSAQKRTGVYGEEWNEGGFGEFDINVDGVRHGYELSYRGHIHTRDGVPQDYGRHIHDRWNDPHRHLHPGDKAPSEAKADGSGYKDRERKETHHAHRVYVNESARIGEAIDRLAMAVRAGTAAYEGGHWKEAHDQHAAAVKAAEAAVDAGRLLVGAMHDLWNDGGPNDRRIVEFESQALGGSLDLDGGTHVTVRRRAAEPDGRPKRKAA